MGFPNTGIIIQSRTGSTRLTNKMIMPFFNNLTVLDILLSRFITSKPIQKIVVATTENESDDSIVEICKNNNIEVFRGDENNVLKRFIDCSEHFNFDLIVRVCGDNPFFDVNGTLKLFDYFNSDNDYLSYKIDNNTPTIKTHLGFWGEIVTLKALKKTNTLTKEKIYQEHVTNFIYSNPEIFNCNFVCLPEYISKRKDIRLTLDTKADFILYQEIYKSNVGDTNEIDIKMLFNYIDNNPDIKKIMQHQIMKYTK